MKHVPASVGQRLLWLMDHYRGSGHALNEQVLMRITGPCDAGAVREAVQRLSARHGSLRTSFTGRGSKLTQVLHPESHPVALREVDVSAAADPVAALRSEVGSEITTAVDVDGLPVSSSLIHTGSSDHMLVLTMNHLVTDDWSNAVISRDIGALYAGVRGSPQELPEVEWQYADWSMWHHELLIGDQGKRLFGYWGDKLAGARIPAITRPPAPLDAIGERDWRSAKFVIEPGVVALLQQLARSRRTTLFPVMLALFSALLHEMTGRDDVTVASLFANRGRPEVRETVGFFVSTLMLRCRLAPGRPFTALVDEARTTMMDAVRHQELPFQLLPVGTVGSASGRADEMMFQFVGALTSRADVVGTERRDLALEDQMAGRRFTLEFVLVPGAGGRLFALLICDREQFGQPWADEFVRRYVGLARCAADDPTVPLSQLVARTVPAHPARV